MGVVLLESDYFIKCANNCMLPRTMSKLIIVSQLGQISDTLHVINTVIVDKIFLFPGKLQFFKGNNSEQVLLVDNLNFLKDF